MNRNDDSIPLHWSSGGGGGGSSSSIGQGGISTAGSGGFAMKPQPKPPGSAGLMSAGFMPMAGLDNNISNKPGGGKAGTGGLLEDYSVHLSLPSFHTKTQGKISWKCEMCQYENCNALSNECSVCGMQRVAKRGGSSAAQAASDQGEGPMNWMNLSSSSANSFSTFDGDHSGNSLSLNNSVSLHEEDLQFMKIDEEPKTPGSITKKAFHTSLPATFHNSLTSIRSTRSVRSGSLSARRSPRRTSRGVSALLASLPAPGVASIEPDMNSSVMSFCEWNPNEKVQNWACEQCTFINENPLHLACELCGHRRSIQQRAQQQQRAQDAAAAAAATVPPEENKEEDHSFSQNSFLSSEEEDEDLRLIQEEQMKELIEVQREIMADFGRRTHAAAGTLSPSPRSPRRESPRRGPRRFDTKDLQREINTIQESVPPLSAGLSTAAYIDDDMDGTNELDLEELLKTTKSILMDFKRQRTSNDYYDSKPPARLSGASSSYNNSNSSVVNDSIFGRTTAPNQANVVTPTTTCLKYSMKSAGGKLHYNDLCLPLLWGDNLGDLKKVPTKSA